MHEHRNDIHLSADGSIDLPTVPSFDRWLYIFRDAVSVRDNQADTHTALTIRAHQTAFEVTASREANVIHFLVNQQAPFFPRSHLERVIVEDASFARPSSG
jgi:redox-sensitive bicupin YhaK (pirin superfamily)